MSTIYSSDKNKNNIMILLNLNFAIYSNQECYSNILDQAIFVKRLWFSVLINDRLCYLALWMNFKQISYLTFLHPKN